MTRPRVVRVFGVVAILAAVLVGTSPAGSSAAPAAGAKPVGGPGRWVQLSSGKGVDNIDDPAVHRFGTRLQVVWAQNPSTGDDDTLHTRIIKASGAPASANKTLLHWTGVNQSPSVFSLGSRRVIAFSGLDGDSGPYSGGLGYYLTSSNGTAWTLADGTFGSNTSLYNVTGADATNAAGTPVLAYTGRGYRAGFDSLPPATTDHAPKPERGCCTYYAGVGYDARSGQTWMTWYSNNGEAGVDGVDAQRLYPSLGRPVHAPSSSSKSDGQIASVGPEQRVQVAARRGGGLYTAYGVGYPTQSKIALWKLGSRKPLLLSTHEQIEFPGVAAAPGGRLWLFWYDRNTGRLHAARTNAAATRIGAIRTVHTPRNTQYVWKTAGDGSNGRLDLIINATVGNSEQMFSTQVLPGLSGRASPGKVSRGGKVTVTITDAGAPVHGAAVHYGGTTKQTNSHGKVVLHVAKGTAKGTHAISFGDSGYAGGTLHVRVT